LLGTIWLKCDKCCLVRAVLVVDVIWAVVVVFLAVIVVFLVRIWVVDLLVGVVVCGKVERAILTGEWRDVRNQLVVKLAATLRITSNLDNCFMPKSLRLVNVHNES